MSGRISHGDVDPWVRLMFQRVLASWAADALELRRAGLDRPVGRPEVSDRDGPWVHPGIAAPPPSLRRAA